MIWTLVTLSAVSTIAGCGAMEQAREAAQRQNMSNNLKMLGIAYHNCHDTNMKGPSGWAEAQQFGLPAEAQQQLEAAGYTVVWGLKMAEAKQGTSNTIIAHQPNAATEGGLVLLLDGSAQQLTAAEVSEKLAAAAMP
jgi:hypothetical protein